MEFVLAIQGIILLLLSVLVLGLLRSHAELLRRSSAPRARAQEEIDPEIPAPPDREIGGKARAVAGQTLTGDAVKVGFKKGGQDTLLAFLSSGCTICADFWEAFQSPDEENQLPRGLRLVVVTKDSSHESPGRLTALAGDLMVVMSSRAWDDFEVEIAPYFVFVEGASGRVHGEGAAREWRQVLSLFGDYQLDRQHAAGKGKALQIHTAGGHDARIDRIDSDLSKAGVDAADPSLSSAAHAPGTAPDLAEFAQEDQAHG